MKDPGGHGSNSKLTSKQGPASPMPHPKAGKGGKGPFQGSVSNAQAAQSLMSALKSTQAPIHPAMVSQQSSGTAS